MSYKITDEEKNRVKMNSPFALPVSPSERGMSPAAIKEMFWKPFNALIEILNKTIEGLESEDADATSQLESHNGAETAHSDIRNLLESALGQMETVAAKANDAYNLAAGRTKVHVVPNFYFMMADLISTGACAGDIYLILEKGVPDFIVIGNGEVDGAVQILEKDLYNLPTPVPGEKYFVQGISVAAIESGLSIPETDGFLSDASTNAVQNKVITEALKGKVNTSDIVDYAQVGETRPISSDGVENELNRVESIAKGANPAKVYPGYAEMIHDISSLDSTCFKPGQNIYIETLGVPDLWVSGVYPYTSGYEYTSDEDFVQDLLKPIEEGGTGGVQVGYYKLSALETQKVNLTEYAKKENLDEKLDKITSTSARDRLYGISKDGTQFVAEVADVGGGYFHKGIPRYSGGGCISVGTPTWGTAAANKDYVDNKIANIPNMGAEVEFTNGIITVENNTVYIGRDIHTLTINYPEGNFICSLQITLSANYDPVVYLPNTSRFIGGMPIFEKGDTIELNIRNGVVAWGKVQ